MATARLAREELTDRPIWAKYVMQWCKDNGTSVSAIARKADVSETTFYKMLAGQWNAKASYLAKIEKAMGIKAGTLTKLNKPKGTQKISRLPKK